MTFPSRLSLVLTASMVLFLHGCGSQQGNIPTQISGDPMQQVAELIQQAETAAPVKSAQLKAEAARILIMQERQEEASRLLDEIDMSILTPALQFEISELKARTALAQQDGQSALRYLQQLPPETTRNLPPEQQYQIGEMQADAYHYQQNTLSELQQLIQLSSYSPADKAQTLHNRIWTLLTQIPTEQLKQLSQRPDNSYYQQGWYELALSAMTAQDLSQQNKQMQQWEILWQSHPAQQTPPEALLAVTATDTLSAEHIALYLPMSGSLEKPAEAISTGFMTAYYNAVKAGRTHARITLLDSTRITSPEQLYQVASEKGVDLIIGPLEKEMVESLLNYGSAPIPTLTLNTVPGSQQPNIYQFGLAIEDEAIQAANQAWQDQKKQVLIYTPDTDWGERAAIAFKQQFMALGGTVLDSYTYGNNANYSEQIATLLGTEKSIERDNQLTRIIGERPEFESRRRQDVDAIFLSALPQTARQIKPTLAFHYAGNIPVYATSQIYSGSEAPIEDQDLNGIRFVATPWLSAPPSSEHLQLAQLRDNTNSRFGRLYALGIDAFNLFPYLAQLSVSSSAIIEGETGTLSIGENNQIVRTLNWVTFQQGVAQPINGSN
ncbi:penicillin-binding protein activator [Amphritea pacifica]|uniref:Penicillin-binding protein activator n=1 Tax=Amphritea pacifica TaxID=2811233 RepID=A0ABS2W7P1_9GAMM|nr:penicillin-binding protein activator [Amphritea pacifica]MBN0987723.1 penicillin-binding protein activator [Amphritea pacifica]MBN1007691.1 penicillin-binding protein activator [Amphritea pacifica]